MEQEQITRESLEWNAQAYAQGNTFQEIASLHFLQDSGIVLENKKILDIGCGTGNITAKIAETAKKIHGIDASKNMIEYAQEYYGNIQNISFEHSFAENFNTKKKYDLALSFFCLHWIQDKQKTLEKINLSLKTNGEFFGTHNSTSDPISLSLTVLQEMIPGFSYIYSFFKTMNWIEIGGYFIISDEKFQELLSATGFELISYEQKSFDIIMSRKDMENTIRPVLMSRPFIQKIPEKIREWFFKAFIDTTTKKLTQQEDGNYIIPEATWGTKIFHARKITNV